MNVIASLRNSLLQLVLILKLQSMLAGWNMLSVAKALLELKETAIQEGNFRNKGGDDMGS